MNFPGKGVLSVFKYSYYLFSGQKSEKTNQPLLRKISNWRTDRQTDRQTNGQTENSDFIGPFIGRGSNYKSNFKLSWTYTNTPKTSLFSPILESCDQNEHPHLWPHPSYFFFNQLLILMNLYRQAKNQPFSSFFFLRYSWFKNPAIWLLKSILAYVSRTRFSQICHMFKQAYNN